jgi:hypothetical protein
LQAAGTADLSVIDAHVALELVQVVAAFRPRGRGRHLGVDGAVRLVHETQASVHAHVAGAQGGRHHNHAVSLHADQLPLVRRKVLLDIGDRDR